eukprot:TRINITY_DN73_c0_g2_i1.p1 TRINITY_DN73_c0_g2~~TRINITY_DN73_c0_g2_i1.p1  ORF type:complete len:464 (-),score=139.50 TRINITY_DN73_c0_g2_i1:229-1620(-)
MIEDHAEKEDHELEEEDKGRHAEGDEGGEGEVEEQEERERKQPTKQKASSGDIRPVPLVTSSSAITPLGSGSSSSSGSGGNQSSGAALLPSQFTFASRPTTGFQKLSDRTLPDGTSARDPVFGSRSLFMQPWSRTTLSKEASDVLRGWLYEHIDYPYPNDEEKRQLAEKASLSMGQINNWFVNARVRIWKPMLESKDVSQSTEEMIICEETPSFKKRDAHDFDEGAPSKKKKSQEDKKDSGSARGSLPKKAIEDLKAWLFDHFHHPYPTEEEKMEMAKANNLTLTQVNNWFINSRRRIWRPLMDSSGKGGKSGSALSHVTRYQVGIPPNHSSPPKPAADGLKADKLEKSAQQRVFSATDSLRLEKENDSLKLEYKKLAVKFENELEHLGKEMDHMKSIIKRYEKKFGPLPQETSVQEPSPPIQTSEKDMHVASGTFCGRSRSLGELYDGKKPPERHEIEHHEQ